MLRFGNYGDPTSIVNNASAYNILYLQQLLNNVGLSLTQTGVMDDQTIHAIKQFQDNLGILEDGVVGNQTWNMLLKANNVLINPSSGLSIDQSAFTISTPSQLVQTPITTGTLPGSIAAQQITVTDTSTYMKYGLLAAAAAAAVYMYEKHRDRARPAMAGFGHHYKR